MIHWTELVRAGSSNFTFSQFIDSFVHPILQLLNSQAKPIIGEDIKKTFHLSEQTKTRDWYLYQNYTEIRIYGSELAPYKFPEYVSMRIFSLEYIR